MVVLTRVHRGGLAAHILSAHVGRSLVNQPPPKHQHLSPQTSDSEKNRGHPPRKMFRRVKSNGGQRVRRAGWLSDWNNPLSFCFKAAIKIGGGGLHLPPPSCLGAGCINTPVPLRASSAQQDHLSSAPSLLRPPPFSSPLLVQLPLTPPNTHTHLPLTSSN